ncbi:MAG: ATP-binding protein [Nitrososphaerota archaeon]|nr:ATP-binding protein [Nitrososphaerota archaeon]
MKRPLDYSPTLARKLAKSLVREDPVRSLVELVTNSDDSFHRSPKEGCKIVISLRRGHDQARFRVFDNAEGMTKEKMDVAVGGYGFDTSGRKEGKGVRGLFGRGLKEAVLGLGNGTVESIKDGTYIRSSLGTDGYYEVDAPRPATGIDRGRMLLGPDESGTLITIDVEAKENDVRIPQFDSLKTSLQKHVSLRDLMTNPKRKVSLVDVNRDITEVLTYKYPLGKQLAPSKELKVPGYPEAVAVVEVWRADEELTQDEDGYMRDGGLLVRSGNAIHCATLFKYDSDRHARRLFGNLRCDYIEKLLEQEEAVISDKRDGLDLQHPFVKSLRQSVEAFLEPIVRKEREDEDAKRKELESAKTKARFQSAVQELNRIAKIELQTNEGPVPSDDAVHPPAGPVPPAVTLQFSTKYAQIVSGKKELLYLKTGVPGYLPSGTVVTIGSNNPEVIILTKSVSLQDGDATNGVVTSRIEVEGRQVGATATVTASAGATSTAMFVKVISKKTPPPLTPPRPPKAGLFKEIRFNDVADPTQRAYYDGSTGVIDVYTRSDSVAMYLGPKGENQEKPECQVLVAELIVDLYCRFLAKLREEKGLLLIPSEKAKLDAIDREHEKLRSKYSPIIHSVIVDKSAHRGLRP